MDLDAPALEATTQVTWATLKVGPMHEFRASLGTLLGAKLHEKANVRPRRNRVPLDTEADR